MWDAIEHILVYLMLGVGILSPMLFLVVGFFAKNRKRYLEGIRFLVVMYLLVGGVIWVIGFFSARDSFITSFLLFMAAIIVAIPTLSQLFGADDKAEKRPQKVTELPAVEPTTPITPSVASLGDERLMDIKTRFQQLKGKE